nr:hypothetical protein [Angustibacter aerolatus]
MRPPACRRRPPWPGSPSSTATARPTATSLLFRGEGVADHTAAGDRATARVLVGAACDIGWRALGGGRPLFLNVGAGMIYDAALEPGPAGLHRAGGAGGRRRRRPAGRAAAGAARAGVRPGARRLRARLGRRPADPAGRVREARRDGAAPRRACPRWWRRLHERGVLAIAERVETREVLDRCVAAGFDLFQGFWFAHPAEQPVMAMSPQRVLCLRLLALLAADDPDLRAVEQPGHLRHRAGGAHPADGEQRRGRHQPADRLGAAGDRAGRPAHAGRLGGADGRGAPAGREPAHRRRGARAGTRVRDRRRVARARDGRQRVPRRARGRPGRPGRRGRRRACSTASARRRRSGPPCTSAAARSARLVADVVAHVGGERPASDLSVQARAPVGPGLVRRA